MIGMIDFSNQTLDSIVEKLQYYLHSLEDVQGLLVTNRNILINNGYWNTVNWDFQRLIEQTLEFYDTCSKEIQNIILEIQLEVQAHHVKRIQHLNETGHKLNLEFGRVWHQEYSGKQYGNQNFQLVEEMYGRGRDMSINIGSLFEVAEGLNDFVGRKNYGLQKTSFDLENVHPNISTLLQRMDDAVKREDYAGVLHSSASIFETLAKEIVGISSVQDQTLGGFFERYKRDSSLPNEVLDYILSVYKLRNSVPLAGHGHTAIPDISRETAIILIEITKAFISIEYKLKKQ